MEYLRAFFYRTSTVVICVLMAVVLTSCERQENVVNGLTEREANEIIVFLASKDIKSTKVRSEEEGGGGGQKVLLWNLAVASSRVTEAMATLNMAGLPRKKGQTLLGLFAGGGLVASEAQDRIRYQAGLAEQIAGTIRKVDGIIDADIQLSFPEEEGFGGGDKPPGKVTASVYVKHQGILDDPNAHLVTKIKRLVASSINGLEFENVTVISDRARFSDVTFRDGGEGGRDAGKELVKVWSVVVEKASVGRFRTIFVVFSISMLILIIVVVWTFWKVYPLLKQAGGVKMLFDLKATSKGKKSKEAHPLIEESEEKDDIEEEEGEEEEDEEDEE